MLYRRLAFPLLLLFLTVLLFLFHITAFIHLFFTHAGITITQNEILDAYTADQDLAVGVRRESYVPKIVHQVFHNWKEPGNETLPSDWEVVSGTCKGRAKGWSGEWEYMLWTESTSRQFIQDEYPWMLKTYDGYRYPVQRVDAVRYFVLYHYGGIYLDLDNGCLRDLTPLTNYPLWNTDGGRGALSNNILGARPKHPFYDRLIRSLITYNYNYFFPYITISYASGQWFETSVWEKYHASLPSLLKGPMTSKGGQGGGSEFGKGEEMRGFRIMMDDRPGTEPWIFFTQERGGSWVNWDNAFWLWIGEHLLLLAVVAGGSLSGVGWYCIKGPRGRRRRVGGRDVRVGLGKKDDMRVLPDV
ncbi:related to SUR1 protein [Rhynchosporium secalis]|uniref:Related to SUR1 protein n=1 Tax=Rhynchosporium secalis TaxID=38038 RepID=A0A1E1MH19_RHYSE|nr:related to SUR1 protein [Rhynchosporium secalis]